MIDELIITERTPQIIAEEIKEQAKAADAQALIMKYDALFAVHRKNLINDFEEMRKTLTELSRRDPEVKERNRQAAHEMLKNLAKMMEVWPPPVKFTIL